MPGFERKSRVWGENKTTNLGANMAQGIKMVGEKLAVFLPRQENISLREKNQHLINKVQ